MQELKDSNWAESNVQEERNNAYSILVAHCIVFLMVSFCQYCSISFKLPYMFIFTVLMHVPTSIACLVLIVKHFAMIATDIDQVRIYQERSSCLDRYASIREDQLDRGMERIASKMTEVLACMSFSFAGLVIIPTFCFFCFSCCKNYRFNPIKDAVDNILFYYLYN